MRPDTGIKRRLDARLSHREETVSDGRRLLLCRQNAYWESIKCASDERYIELDTIGPSDADIRRLVGKIYVSSLTG